MYVCVSMCVYVRFCLCVCVYAYVCMCVYACVTYIYMCECMYAYTYICVYTCEHARQHLSLPVYVGVHAPILLYVFSFYPILCVTKRWPVTQLRLRRRLVRAISLPCAFPLRLVGTNFGPSLFVFSYCSLH